MFSMVWRKLQTKIHLKYCQCSSWHFKKMSSLWFNTKNADEFMNSNANRFKTYFPRQNLLHQEHRIFSTLWGTPTAIFSTLWDFCSTFESTSLKSMHG